LALLYYLFRRHHVMPGTWAKMSAGEQDLVWAFAAYEIEQRNAQ